MSQKERKSSREVLSNRGAALVEYMILLALIACVCAMGIPSITESIAESLNKASKELEVAKCEAGYGWDEEANQCVPLQATPMY